MWLPVTSGTQMWQPTRLDSTRLDSTLPQTVCHCLWPVDLWHGAHAACCNVACCLLAAYFVCLNAGSVAGHSRLWQEAHGRASHVATGNWQLPQMVASNKCCQHVGTHICALCSASVLQLGLELHLLCRVAAADGVAALATGIETAIASAAIRFLLDNANSVLE